MELVGPFVRLLGLDELGLRLLHVRRLVDRRQVPGVFGAVSGEGAGQRRAFALDVVLLLLAVEFDQDLTGRDPVTQIGQQAADPAVGF